MSVLAELLAWSEKRPAWQRDALRRIVVQTEIDDAEIEALAALCKAPHGLATDVPPSQPIDESHLNAPSAPQSAVCLKAVKHIGEVNALVPEQTLKIGETGLTVIYGDNASGKSGYTRILKSACRARGAQEDVLTNVLSEQLPGKPTAELTYSFGSEEKIFTWTPEAAAPAALSRVSVFDTHSAAVYVSEKTDVAFRPYGLDIFDRLAAVTDRVRKIVENERKLLERRAIALPTLEENTSAHKFLSSLSSLTTEAQVDDAAHLSEKELERLSALTVELLNDESPEKRATQLRARAQKVTSLKSSLNTLGTVLGASTETALRDARQRASTAANALDKLKQELADAFLPRTGGDEWTELWSAAAAFSKVAYPDHSHPRVEEDSQCVLCQQTVSEIGRSNLQTLSSFSKSDSQTEVQTARRVLTQKVDKIRTTDTSMPEAIADVALEDKELSERVSSFLATTSLRVNQLVENVGVPESLPATEALEEALANLAKQLETTAATVEATATPDKRKELEREMAELQARRDLAKNRDIVIAEIHRRRALAAYALCLKDLSTNAITRKGTELTKKTVTDALGQAFQDEITALRFNHVEVQLKPVAGSKGALYHQIRLVMASTVDLPKVIREGESRCLALAGFLAELAVTSERSAILFDDPVSSLDHMWRDNVAERLAQEAKHRQVVVFTHDVVFLTTLKKLAEEAGATWTSAYLRRDARGPGVITPSLPWVALGVSGRIGALKQMWVQAEKANRKIGPAVYEAQAKSIYGLLREAWERAIEEVLLNGAVERFRKSIETKRIEKLIDISGADYAAIEQAMGKCSTWLTGHDQPAAVNSPVPGPDELEQDINDLEKWIAEVRGRRKKK